MNNKHESALVVVVDSAYVLTYPAMASNSYLIFKGVLYPKDKARNMFISWSEKNVHNYSNELSKDEHVGRYVLRHTRYVRFIY